MFVAHHIHIFDRQFRSKMAVRGGDVMSKHAKLCDLVPKVRRLGNDNFTNHIVYKKQQLCDQLAIAEGFECVADDDGETAKEAVVHMLEHMQHVSAIWKQTLPSKVYCKAIGKLPFIGQYSCRCAPTQFDTRGAVCFLLVTLFVKLLFIGQYICKCAPT